MVTLNINGQSYNYPELDDEDWGDIGTGAIQALATLLQGLRNPSLPVATSGNLRMGNGDVIAWRNQADDNNVKLYVDTDNKLYVKIGASPPIDLTAAAGGNVTGPLSSTDNALTRFDGTSGQTIQDSGVTLSDGDDLAGINDISMDGNLSGLVNLSMSGDLTGLVDLTMSGDLTGANLVSTDDLTLGGTAIEDVIDSQIADQLAIFVPIGTVIPFYDFNGALTFNTSKWAYCNGQTKTVTGIGSQTLPDLSGRYIVGFGTDGGADIGSASWSTSAVGNAGHTVDLSHTHTGPSHTHGLTGAAARIEFQTDAASPVEVCRYDIISASFTGDRKYVLTNTGLSGDFNSASNSCTSGVAISGPTDTGGTGATGSSLSSTQSIQPRSLRFRYLMRYA